MTARPTLEMAVARDDEEWSYLPITSRDILQAEKAFKDFTVGDLASGRISMRNVYRVGYIAMKRAGRVEPEMTLGEFENVWLVSITERAADAPSWNDDDQDDDTDPTNGAR